jgi:hypothetical protein
VFAVLSHAESGLWTGHFNRRKFPRVKTNSATQLEPAASLSPADGKSTEPTIEFYIALNFTALSPRDPSYWRRCLDAICADLVNRHGIHACGCVGAYRDVPKLPSKAFYLFSLLLDLDTQKHLDRYHEVEAGVEEMIRSYTRP